MSHQPRTFSNHQSSIPRFTLKLGITSLLSLACLLAVYLSHIGSQPLYPLGSLPDGARGKGAGSCRMSFMSPSYVRLDGFGREYTRLGDGPWGLYLYREAGWDADPFTLTPSGQPVLSLQGTPVIFAPGNAGSFRQVRSLASAASRQWFELPGVRRKTPGGLRDGGKPLDFFALDFNEDFSAFHGQTLRDQAEYLADAVRFVLSLYHAPAGGLPDPTSVIVVAHSMGGIVARAALLHPHYQSNSISTLLTISTPHLVPPVTVDRGVDAVYDAISAYWRAGYGLIPTTPTTSRAPDELANFVLVSIGGGLSDVTIASESTSLASLLPPGHSHGFAVSTTGIPGIWTPIDHLAMLWCQQLMTTVAQSLLAIVDVREPTGVVPRAERVARLGDRLVGPLERPPLRLEGRVVALSTLERGITASRQAVGERLVLRPEQAARGRTVHLLPVPVARTYVPARAFSLLTSAAVGRSQESAVEVYACSFVDASSAVADDDSGSARGSPSCTALFPSHLSQVPASVHALASPVLPGLGDDEAMGFVSVDVSQLEGMDSIAVVVKESFGQDWVVAEFGPKGGEGVKVVEKTALQLLLGWKMEAYPTTPSLVSEVSLPALDSSLLVLKLDVFRSECQETTALFAPTVRQYAPHVHESHFFPNVRSASLYTHSTGPYLPPAVSPFAGAGVRLQFFLDPTCATGGDVALKITVDLWRTLGALVMRYRMAAVAFPFAIVMVVVSRQLRVYNAGGSFVPFGQALSLFVHSTLAPLMAGLTALSVLQAVLVGTRVASSAATYAVQAGQALHMSLPPAWMSNLLLGNEGAHWAGLAAFVLFALVGVVAAEYLLLHAIVAGATFVIRTVHHFSPGAVRSMVPLGEPRETLATQRVLSMGLLLLLVLFFAPYQFAFLVIFLVHLFSTVRARLVAEDCSANPTTAAATRRAWDRYHYSFALLFVMATLLPINALILIVWVRNLAVGWLAPFSSDHNVLSIVGFLLNVEALHSGKMLQRTKGRLAATATTALAWSAALFGLLYGIRYAHNVYPLTNAFFLWLAAHHSSALVGAVHDAVVGRRRASNVPTPQSDLLQALRAEGGVRDGEPEKKGGL